MARIAFFLIALVMFATANPLAHGQTIGTPLGGGLIGFLLRLLSGLLGGIPVSPGTPVPLPPTVPPTLPPLIQGLNITGRLCCTPTGVCNATGASPPLSGALVNTTCSNPIGSGTLAIGPLPTSMNGFLNITLGNVADGFVRIPPAIPCNITVNPSPLVCPVLAGAGGAVGTVLPVVLTPVALVVDTIRGLILILRFSINVGA